MNYLVISSEFPPGPGGIGQHAASFVRALAKRAHVYVLANQDYAEQEEVARFNEMLPTSISLSNFALRQGKATSIVRISQAVKLVKEVQPTVVFVSGRFPLWIGALLKYRFPNTRVEGFVHGTEITLTGSLLSSITRRAYAKLDRIIAVSNFTKSLLHESISAENVIVVPNGLDAEFLEKCSDIAEVSNWKGNPKLLTVGNVTPRKGQHRVVVALPKILAAFPDTHYHVVGLPTEGEKLLMQAKELGVARALTIHGRMAARADLYRAFVSADVFIMLSENQADGDLEGFGIAILEANAFGLPAIGATGCGIDDAISPESGKLVDGNNAEEIVSALKSVLGERELYSAGAKKWAQKHNWGELINQII